MRGVKVLESTYPIAPKGLGTAFTETEVPIEYCTLMRNRYINAAGGAEKRQGIAQLGSTISGGPYGKLNATPVALATLSYVDNTGVGGTKYFYVVTAVDASGFESAFSNEATGTFLVNPATPAGVSVTEQ